MIKFFRWFVLISATALICSADTAARQTRVHIVGEAFYINDKPTYAGRSWQGHKIEGLLMNARLVQGLFDDLNEKTRSMWNYPDGRAWDPLRNTNEFITMMPVWRKHGLLAFTLNLQGGSPQGYSKPQPWHNSAFRGDGSLRADYLKRLSLILNKADELGMVVILGYFYFGQDERVQDETAVLNAVDSATRWILDQGYKNVLVEVNNECNIKYDHDVLKPDRVHELIQRIHATKRNSHRLLVGTSFGGGTIPGPHVTKSSDFILLHGNGVAESDRLVDMVKQTRLVPGYTAKPILFNEDDHFNFDQPRNNFIAAISAYASWGYFDYRMPVEGFDEGYQSVPVNWGISSERKRGFFRLLRDITGASLN